VGSRIGPVFVLAAACASSPWFTVEVGAQASASQSAAGPDADGPICGDLSDAHSSPSARLASFAASVAGAQGNLPVPVADSLPQPFVDWLRARLPPAGRVDHAADGSLEVVHTVAAGDTTMTIA
jgi:hypothetical protein